MVACCCPNKNWDLLTLELPDFRHRFRWHKNYRAFCDSLWQQFAGETLSLNRNNPSTVVLRSSPEKRDRRIGDMPSGVYRVDGLPRDSPERRAESQSRITGCRPDDPKGIANLRADGSRIEFATKLHFLFTVAARTKTRPCRIYRAPKPQPF